MLVVKFGHKGLIANLDNLNGGIDAWTMELVWGSIFNINKKLKENYATQLYSLL
jgi:hypothetical protein